MIISVLRCHVVGRKVVVLIKTKYLKFDVFVGNVSFRRLPYTIILRIQTCCFRTVFVFYFNGDVI